MPNPRRSVPLLISLTLGSTLFAAALCRPAPPAPAKAAKAPKTALPATPSAVGHGELAPRLAALEKALDARREELHVPGVALAVVQGDRVVYARGLGLKDVEKRLPVTADTLFAIGSCTKVFTALLAEMAQDERRLSLDDPPRKYLPWFKLQDPEADAQVTLRDLMSHRTGLDSEDSSLWYDGKLDREQAIRAAMAAPAVSKFRQVFHYNNLLYTAAGEAVARAEGSTWEDLVTRRLLVPLGMKESDVTRDEMQASPDHASGYELPGPHPVPMKDVTSVAPAGAINSSARDMARWLRFMLAGGALDGKRLVSARGFAELGARNILVREGTYYGLGWGLKPWSGHDTYGHNGGIDGFNAVVSTMPDQKLGFVLLTNVSESGLMKEIAEIVYGHLVGDAKPAGAAKR